MIATFVAKELRHHGPVAFLAFILSIVWLCTQLGWSLANDQSSLLQVPASAIRILAPAYAVLAANRLFIHERRSGTWQFLASLPIDPAVVCVVKIAFGALATMATCVFWMAATALLLRRRELIAADWLVVMIIQVMVYAFAWFGVATLFAQLGRHRLVAWTVLLSAMAGSLVVSERFMRGYLWFDVVWLPIDHTRFAPPIGGIFLAILWGVGTIALSVLLVLRKNGMAIVGWFEPMTTQQRALAILQIVVILSTPLVFMAGWEPTPNYALLPKVGSVAVAARPGSPLYRAAQELNRELEALKEPLDIDEWPIIMMMQNHDPQAIAVAAAERAGDVVMLRIKEDASEESMLRASLGEALDARIGGLVRVNAAEAWVARGFAYAWLRRHEVTSAAFERRVAWAARQGVTTEDLERWPHLTLRLGSDVAEAVAWIGLETVAREAGEDRLMELARRVLGGYRPLNSSGIVLQRWMGNRPRIEEVTGLKWASLADAWVRRLGAPEDATMEGGARADVRRACTSYGTPALFWVRKANYPAELWHAATGPLSAVPEPWAPIHRVELDAPLGSVSIAYDDGARVVATFAWFSKDMDGWIIDGWREVLPE